MLNVEGTVTRDNLAFLSSSILNRYFLNVQWRFLNFLFAWLFWYLYFKFLSSSSKMLHNLQVFHWTRLEFTQACLLNTLEHSKCNLWTCLGCFMRVPGTCFGTEYYFSILKRVQKTHAKLPKWIQRKFSSVFSETAANYEAFC
jgi:hypothetical protein